MRLATIAIALLLAAGAAALTHEWSAPVRTRTPAIELRVPREQGRPQPPRASRPDAAPPRAGIVTPAPQPAGPRGGSDDPDDDDEGDDDGDDDGDEGDDDDADGDD
jgi:hypothetical protein